MYHDEAAGGRASAKRPAEILRDVPAVRERFAPACHARLQCRSIPSFGEREDTQKQADPKAGGWRQKHLSGVYRLLQLQGETARHAAQTEKGGVCAALYSVIKHVPCIFIQGTCIHSFLIWLFA